MRGSMIICVLLLASIAQIYAQDTVYLSGTIRDQGPDTMCQNRGGRFSCGEANGGRGFQNTDFEIFRSYQNSVKGILGAECHNNNIGNCGVLGADGTPTLYLKPMSTGQDQTQGNIYSYDSFNRWFHNDPTNRQIPISIPLHAIGGGNYQFQNDNFFPIDGQGWKDQGLAGDGLYHNFGFCLEAHSRFGYRGDEIFTFDGDDDMYVFINNRMAVDLGALHPSSQGSVNLSSVERALGIQKGSNYRFDVFYCERHTVFSHCKITSNLELYCSYTDACGICEGNGQSCCDKSKCNDNNPCTVDSCDVHTKGACVHSLLNCPAPSDPCMQSQCATSGAQAGQCVTTTTNCDDGNPCTVDSCTNNAGTPQCVHTAKCTAHSGDQCTSDTCDANGNCGTTDISQKCFIAPNDKCNVYSCDKVGGCKKAMTICDDGNPCTDDSCDPKTGCKHSDPCASMQTDACTQAVCRTSGCALVPINCPGNRCNVSSCDPKKGCQTTPLCTDNKDACVIETCQLATGSCALTPVNCDDGNACTTDTCDSAKGCAHTTVTCNVDKCHTATCDPKNGCITQPINCDDKNQCTDDSCDAQKGCVNTPINVATRCNDNNACTSDTCAAAVGCQHTPITCPDKDCNTVQCSPISGCQYTPLTSQCVKCPGGSCISNDACVIASCDEVQGKCVTTPKNCNDSNACTKDSCSNGNCAHTAVTCPQDASNLCLIPSCDATKGCIATKKSCDDNNPCTQDLCNPKTGACTNIQTATYCEVCGTSKCESNSSCNPNVCDQATTKCKSSSVDCDDKNACTADSCNPLNPKPKCVNTIIPVVIDNPCSPMVCDPAKGNIAAPFPCDDGDNCTTDSCVAVNGKANCTHTQITCDKTDLCNPQTCFLGSCVVVPKVCNDNTLCNSGVPTANPTNPAGPSCDCVYTPKNCSSFDLCNPTACDPKDGSCFTSSNTTCQATNLCYTSAPACDGSLGCVSTPTDHCNDHNLCTEDKCGDGTGPSSTDSTCSYTNKTCPPIDACSMSAGCNSTTGNCTYIPKVCPTNLNFCLLATCDPIAGCINVTRVCNGPTQDDNCFLSVCSIDAGKCQDVRRPDFSTREAKGGILCPLAYDKTAQAVAIGTAGAAAIAVGGAAALGLAGFGGKKAFDHFAGGSGAAKTVSTNPLYESNLSAGDNPLYTRL